MNWVAIFDRAEDVTLDSEHLVALAKIARQAIDRYRKLLSSCQQCGGRKVYVDGHQEFECDPDCPVQVLESIEPLECKDG